MPEENLALSRNCTMKKSARRKQIDEMQSTDWKQTTLESKLAAFSESERLSDSDHELLDNPGHPKRMKDQ